jgi:hypothetical protein
MKYPKLYAEPNVTHSEFLTFSGRLDRFAYASGLHEIGLPQSSMGSELDGDVDVPALTFLRLELIRIKTGMSDYIIRVATPKFQQTPNSNTIVSMRGDRSLAKVEGVQKLAALIVQEMNKRNDSTHTWVSADVDHLTRLLFPTIRFFSTNPHIETLRFATEALS